MLEVKNIIEDIVLDIIDNLDVSSNGTLRYYQKIELASYVLNRLKPMYITSNKGFSHIIARYRNDPQFMADIMVIVNQGLNVIQKIDLSNKKIDQLNLNLPYYYFPRIYGKIVSSKTFLPLKNATISLYIDGKLAEILFSDWGNPLKLEQDDEGIISFAPRPFKADRPLKPKTFEIKILIQQNKKQDEKFWSLTITPGKISDLTLHFKENILQLEDIYVAF